MRSGPHSELLSLEPRLNTQADQANSIVNCKRLLYNELTMQQATMSAAMNCPFRLSESERFSNRHQDRQLLRASAGLFRKPLLRPLEKRSARLAELPALQSTPFPFGEEGLMSTGV